MERNGKQGRREEMWEDSDVDQPPTSSNSILHETGSQDVRFMLWKQFCAAKGLRLETLPSELTDETKTEWEKLKESDLSPSNKS